MTPVRVGVVGAGAFGLNHLRVLSALEGVAVSGVMDVDRERAAEAAGRFNCLTFPGLDDLIRESDAAIVAVPTVRHAEVGCRLLDGGLDVLVEKPIASDLDSAARLLESARRSGRILQPGHLERFNPAVRALKNAATLPLFFEIHRMSMFTPRSLDVDVVLDLMIHDVDILLSLTGQIPDEIRAAGIRILSPRVDIANVRLAFPNGCVANLTASRVSVEKIRKLRLFQPGEYIAVDYSRQDVSRVRVKDGNVSFDAVEVEKEEPLRLELQSFIDCVRTRKEPEVSAEDAVRALSVCQLILNKIEEHGEVVERTVSKHLATTRSPLSS